MVGAEKLLGKGDMLFYPSGQSKPSRLQGAFVTDQEVEAIVDFLKKSSKPNYTQETIDQITAAGKVGGAAEDSDEFFSQAVDLILEKEKASVSMLQRQFRIGYNRAARLMDDLEKQGIVGPDRLRGDHVQPGEGHFAAVQSVRQILLYHHPQKPLTTRWAAPSNRAWW